MKSVLPKKYYLDKHYYKLREDLLNKFKAEQKRFNNDTLKMFSQYEPMTIVEELIDFTISSIRPRLKNNKII